MDDSKYQTVPMYPTPVLHPTYWNISISKNKKNTQLTFIHIKVLDYLISSSVYEESTHANPFTITVV